MNSRLAIDASVVAKKLPDLVEPILRAARIPGAALAICSRGEVLICQCYGERDTELHLPMTPSTLYPIASTTKAITATLLGTLVDDGLLDWDVPVTEFLLRFRLRDPIAGAHATVRDLFRMHCGLPRHDWVWEGYRTSRPQLLESLRHLEPSATFRERFQYNNILITIAGHVAEVVSGNSWEQLVKERILDPLGMNDTLCSPPPHSEITCSYHENRKRELVRTRRVASDVTAPSGGSLYSTIEDMARWTTFNLSQKALGPPIVRPDTLREIHTPHVLVGTDSTATSSNAAYGMGWFIDRYNCCPRLSHGGYIHDVSSDVALYPADDLGLVAFTNFGCPLPARYITQHAFDLLKGLMPEQSVADRLADYAARIAAVWAQNDATTRIAGTSRSHGLADYAGAYLHPGYGVVEIFENDGELVFVRGAESDGWRIPLERWHYDVWVGKDGGDLFPIYEHNPFDPSGRVCFDMDGNGAIAGLSVRLEPAVEPVRFVKQPFGTIRR